MSYIALYRKYRPSAFEEVRGQNHIISTLRNQIKADRIGHAYLFVGTRGTGKTTVAKIFARAVNCENPQDGSPCGECPVCRAQMDGASLNIVELDAASNNGVDDVRQIIGEMEYSPTMGRYRVYIIDEVHMFSTSAFNALLKSLEEPPAHVIFILATTEAQKIPVTILSRCQRYDFHRITMDEIRGRLAKVCEVEGIKAEEQALSYIARAADGALRDGLSLLDQCAAFHYGETLTKDMVLDVLGAVEVDVYGRLFSHLMKNDMGGALDLVADAVGEGRDLTQYVSDFVWYLRNLMLIKAAGDASHLDDVSTENKAALVDAAAGVDIEVVIRYIRIFSELSQQIRFSSAKRILLETAVIRLLRPQTSGPDEDLAARVKLLENKADESERKYRAALEKLKNGDFVPNSVATYSNPEENDREKKAKVIAKAMPDDTKKAVLRWNDVVSRLGGLLKQLMKGARLTVDPDGTLVIARDTEISHIMEGGDGQDQAALLDAIQDTIGARVECRFIAAGEANESDLFEVSELEKIINFDVEIEEGSEE